MHRYRLSLLRTTCFLACAGLLACGGSSDSDPDASVSVDAMASTDGGSSIDAAGSTDGGPPDALGVDATPAGVQSITPNTGFYPGGLTVTIAGMGFDSAAAVTIGGAPCTDVNVVSVAEITCSTPSGSVGAADVMVSAAGGNVTLAGGFTYKGFTRIDTVAGTGALAATNGAGDVASFSGAVNEIVVVGDTAYVTDGTNYAIRSIDLSGLDVDSVSASDVTVATLAGDGTSATTDSSDNTGATASFLQPDAIGVSSPTSLVVVSADWSADSSSAIREVDLATGNTTTRVNNLLGLGGYARGSGSLAYVSDCGDRHLVSTLNLMDNTLADFVGNPNGSGDAVGMGSAANFYCPFGMAMNRARTVLYVAEWDNHKLKAIDIATATASDLAGAGTAGSGDNPDGSMARFNHPAKVTQSGNYLFVTDLDGCTIRQIDVTTTAVTTIAGTGACTSTDGLLATATLQYPNGIVYDPRFGIFLTSSDYGWRVQTGDGKIRLLH